MKRRQQAEDFLARINNASKENRGIYPYPSHNFIEDYRSRLRTKNNRRREGRSSTLIETNFWQQEIL